MKSLSKLIKNGIPRSVSYYMMRAAQRWALLSLAGVTLTYWIVQITLTVNLRILNATSTRVPSEQSQQLYSDINKANSLLSKAALSWAVACAIVTLCLVAYSRVRKHDKRLVVDSLVVVGFCLVSIVFSQVIIRTFVTAL